MLDIISFIIIVIFTILAFIRGAIKEIFGLAGIFISIMVTMEYSEFFMDMFNFKSLVVNLLVSSGLVYLICFIFITTLSSWIIHLLRPLCLNPMDRYSGILIGFVKGFFLAYLVFLGIELTIHTFAHKEDEDKSLLPSWISEAKVYPIFSYLEDNMDDLIPEDFYERIKEVGIEMQGSLHQKKPKEKKKSGLFEENLD